MGKSALIKKIHNAAVNYQKYLAGRTFLYVYDDSVVEIVFKSSSFQHLTGVKTNLKAKGYIDEVHAMTYDEALAITGSANHTNGLRKIKASYWLASGIRYTNLMRFIQYNGDIFSNNQRCFGVRPVVSLVAGVYITGGDGTEGNEYVLGKE